MREIRLYGSEGGEAKAFPTPIIKIAQKEMGIYAKLSKDTDTGHNLFLYGCHL